MLYTCKTTDAGKEIDMVQFKCILWGINTIFFVSNNGKQETW